MVLLLRSPSPNSRCSEKKGGCTLCEHAAVGATAAVQLTALTSVALIQL